MRYAQNIKLRILCVAFLFVNMGCASYQTKVAKARQDLESHNYESAIAELKPLADTPGDDQLIYVFDLATIYQVAGQYEESNKYFQLADQLSDLKNYVSISKQAASLILSEEFTQYKGEDFERLLINVFGAINYTMLRNRESALVEVRRLNEKLEYYRLEQKKEYEQNTAAMYLSAVLWEAEKDWDAAYIDYERAYNRDPNIPLLKEDLLRLARKAKRNDQFDKWSKKFNMKIKPEWMDKNSGEIILIYQQGWGPRKEERDRVVTAYGFVSPGFPKLEPVSSWGKKGHCELYPSETNFDGGALAVPLQFADTEVIYNVQDTAIKTLEDAFAPLIAKRVAAYIAKEAAARAISQKNEGVGALLSLAMHIADRADLRQWSTLPQSIQVARMHVKPGKYKFKVEALSSSNSSTGEVMPIKEIEVKPGEKVILNWRSFR